MNAVDIGPIPPSERRQQAVDLFIIFACANIVATTFQTGASLVPAFSLRSALTLVAIGSVSGSLLIALLSAVGPRLGVPSVIAARAALGIRGAGLVALLLYTTNFVNIYMSSLALRSLVPRAGDQATVWSTGLIAAGLSLFSGAWLDRYASFMMMLGGVLVPVGGILLARFYLVRAAVRTESLYDPAGEFGRHWGFDVAGLTAWACGGAAYYLARSYGGTLPALAVAVGVYLLMKRTGSRDSRQYAVGGRQ